VAGQRGLAGPAVLWLALERTDQSTGNLPGVHRRLEFEIPEPAELVPGRPLSGPVSRPLCATRRRVAELRLPFAPRRSLLPAMGATGPGGGNKTIGRS